MHLRIARTLALAVSAFALCAQEKPAEKLAPYYPTPQLIVEKMLDLGGLKAGEKMFDLGSGDGRVVILAAQRFKANATGIEFDDSLYLLSSYRIRSLGLSQTARIIEGDVLNQDYTSADLLTVYLLEYGTGKLTPMLEKQLKKGARVVAHDYPFSSWTPVRTEQIDDEEGRTHKLYLYRR